MIDIFIITLMEKINSKVFFFSLEKNFPREEDP